MAERDLNNGMEIPVKKRMTVKFIVSAIIVVFVQVFIFVSIFMLWGAASKEKKQCYKQLKNMVLARSSAIESYIENKQEAVEYFQNNIVGFIDESSEAFFNENGENPCGNRHYNQQLLTGTGDEIRDLMNTSKSRGAFIALATDSVGDFHQGIYIRVDDYDNESLLIGDLDYARQLGISVADKWQETFRITDSKRCDYYHCVEEAVLESDNVKNDEYGWLSPKFTFHGDNQEVITYTVPLTGKNGELFGILGIELDLKDLESELPYSELGNASDNMYYITRRNSDGLLVKEVLSANAGSDVSDKDGVLDYTNISSLSFYSISSNNNTFIASVQPLNFAGMAGNSYNDEWQLLGVVNEKALLSSYHQNLIHTIFLLVLVAILGAVSFAYWIVQLSRKMHFMAMQVRDNTPQSDWHLDKSGIGELDMLGDVCRDLFERSLSYAKLAETIDLINMPIGAIEYDENVNHVFCTDRASEILELHNTDGEGQYMDRQHFETEIQVLKKSIDAYEDEKDTYHMISKNGKDKYVKIKYIEYKDKWLIAVMDVTEDIKERKKIEYERDHDALTHLINRRAFRYQVSELLEMEDLGCAAIAMFDLDNLKYFNDTYGHDYGDKYICAAASVLGKVADERTLVARISGDEFLIFLYGYEHKEAIKYIVDNVHKNLKESSIWVPDGEKVKLRASAGIAWYPDDAQDLDQLIRFADFAMYESKNNMKGTLNEFDREQFKKNKVLFSGSEELNRLLENSENVRYAFHPIINARTGEIFAYEVLMRPQIEALRSPEDVMRLATAQSRLYDVEYMTWNEALKAADAQRKQGDKFKLFINSVPNHELKGEDLRHIAQQYGHLLSRVVIEIIESEQTDSLLMESKFKWAQQYGMGIALDDFGTGYSNESTLLFLNPQFVKIDMSMVMGISKDENKQKIVQNLLSYTKTRDIQVIAEGIENYEDMDTLIRFGVDYMQGWYFMKPQFEVKDIDDKFKKEIIECHEKWS